MSGWWVSTNWSEWIFICLSQPTVLVMQQDSVLLDMTNLAMHSGTLYPVLTSQLLRLPAWHMLGQLVYFCCSLVRVLEPEWMAGTLEPPSGCAGNIVTDLYLNVLANYILCNMLQATLFLILSLPPRAWNKEWKLCVKIGSNISRNVYCSIVLGLDVCQIKLEFVRSSYKSQKICQMMSNCYFMFWPAWSNRRRYYVTLLLCCCCYLRVCYERVKFVNPVLATFILSAWWHGFYPGYYIFFITLSLDIMASRKVPSNISCTVASLTGHSVWLKGHSTFNLSM